MPNQNRVHIPREPARSSVPLRFSLICTLLLLTAVWLEPSLGPFNRLTAVVAGRLLSAAGFAPVVTGDSIALGGFAVRIVTECTSLYATLLLASFVLAWPATFRARLAGVITGGAVIGAANLLRIAVVTVIGSRDPVRFEILHVYFGQVIMLLLVIGCSLAWLQWCSGERGGVSFVFRALCWATILFLPWLMVHKLYLALVDSLVRSVCSLLCPQYAITTPLPLPIYNHPFSLPLFLALLLSSSGLSRRRAIGGGVAGVLLLTAGHALFRGTHIIWTAFDVPEIGPIHQTVYLLGQFLLPVLLWLLVTRRAANLLRSGGRSAVAAPLALLLVLLFSPEQARAATSLQLYPNGRGGFALRGENLNRVRAVGVTLRYDTLTDGKPDVVPFGLAAQAGLKIEPNSDGTLEFSLDVKPPDAGFASITPEQIDIGAGANPGARRGKSPAGKPRIAPPTSLSGSTILAVFTLPGPITNANGWVRNSQGGTESVVVTYRNPPDGDWSSPRKLQEPVAVSPTPATPRGEQVVISLPQRQEETLSKPKKVLPPPTFRRLPAISEQFMALSAARDAAALSVLLSRSAQGPVRQEPPVAVADGMTPVRLTVGPSVGEAGLSNMLLSGASVVEVLATDEGGWQLDVLPKAGTCTASLTLLQGNELIEYPLTVVPLTGWSAETGCPEEYLSAARELAGLGGGDVARR